MLLHITQNGMAPVTSNVRLHFRLGFHSIRNSDFSCSFENNLSHEI